MARADPYTWLPLDRWAQILGINPLHFNGLNSEFSRQACGSIWHQYEWQDSDHVSREQVARAIEQAETQIASVVNYHLVPDWSVAERVLTDRHFQKDRYYNPIWDVSGRQKTVRSRWAYLISGGIRTKTLVDPDPAGTDVTICLWDPILQTCTPETGKFPSHAVVVVANPTNIDPCEIRVYFHGHDGSDDYEIRPIEVTKYVDLLSGADYLLVKIRTWLLVDPELEEGFDAETTPIDGDDPTTFVSTVDVYREWNDPSTQVELIWSQSPNSCGCGADSCPVCNFTTVTGCLRIQDHQLGMTTYHPAMWDVREALFTLINSTQVGDPDRLRLWYYSGWQYNRATCPNRMDPFWETAVAYYSVTFLERPVAECTNVEQYIERWRDDMSLNVAGEGGYSHQVDLTDLSNPFGPYRGALFAWNRVKQEGRRVPR